MDPRASTRCREYQGLNFLKHVPAIASNPIVANPANGHQGISGLEGSVGCICKPVLVCGVWSSIATSDFKRMQELLLGQKGNRAASPRQTRCLVCGIRVKTAGSNPIIGTLITEGLSVDECGRHNCGVGVCSYLSRPDRQQSNETPCLRLRSGLRGSCRWRDLQDLPPQLLRWVRGC